MNKKLLFKFGYMGLYLIGFPLLAILTLVYSIQWNSYGMYGAGAFAPFIFTVIVWAICGGTQFGVWIYKKKKGKSNDKFCFKNAILPLMLIFAIFIIVEAALPSILTDATSDTILYEDVVEDADGMHAKLQDRVNLYLKKNGFKEGTNFQDAKVQKQFDKIFGSMDKAYDSFDDLAISLALKYDDVLTALGNGKLPLPVMATLLLKTSELENANNRYLTIEEILALNKAEIVQAVDTLVANISNISDPEVLNQVVNEFLLTKTFDGIEWNILQILGENIINPAVDPNAVISQTVAVPALDEEGNKQFDEEGNLITKDVTTEIGACLGYQDMAWLNGLDQMFFIPLLACRTIFLVFGLVIAAVALLSELLKTAYVKKFEEGFTLSFKK